MGTRHQDIRRRCQRLRPHPTSQDRQQRFNWLPFEPHPRQIEASEATPRRHDAGHVVILDAMLTRPPLSWPSLTSAACADSARAREAADTPAALAKRATSLRRVADTGAAARRGAAVRCGAVTLAPIREEAVIERAMSAIRSVYRLALYR